MNARILAIALIALLVFASSGDALERASRNKAADAANDETVAVGGNVNNVATMIVANATNESLVSLEGERVNASFSKVGDGLPKGWQVKATKDLNFAMSGEGKAFAGTEVANASVADAMAGCWSDSVPVVQPNVLAGSVKKTTEKIEKEPAGESSRNSTTHIVVEYKYSGGINYTNSYPDGLPGDRILSLVKNNQTEIDSRSWFNQTDVRQNFSAEDKSVLNQTAVYVPISVDARQNASTDARVDSRSWSYNNTTNCTLLPYQGKQGQDVSQRPKGALVGSVVQRFS